MQSSISAMTDAISTALSLISGLEDILEALDKAKDFLMDKVFVRVAEQSS